MAEKSLPLSVQNVFKFLDCLDAFDELCQSDNDDETNCLDTTIKYFAEQQSLAVAETNQPAWFDDKYNQPKRKERKYEKPAKYLKDKTNPMEICDDEEFLKMYRFNKNTVKDITDMIMYGLSTCNNRGQPVPPVVKLCIVLRYLATGNLKLG